MTTVFTYNQHPAYIYLLSHVDAEFYVVGSWDVETRPHPENIQFVSPDNAGRYASKADVWLSHLITPDLIRFIRLGRQLGWPERIVQVMHGRSDRTGHIDSEFKRVGYWYGKKAVIPLLWLGKLTGKIEYVYISDYVADSWKVRGKTIYPAVLPEIETHRDTEDYVLVVGNELHRGHFEFDILQEVLSEDHFHVCGRNPKVDAGPGRVSWTNLKSQYQGACCYVNLLQQPENSFNLATLEALGSGVPIVTLDHPRSVFEHEETALVCTDAREIEDAIDRLRRDKELARELAANAKHMANNRFDISRFRQEWLTVLTSS